MFCTFAHDLFTVAVELLYQSVFVPIYFHFHIYFYVTFIMCTYIEYFLVDFMLSGRYELENLP